MCSQFPLYLSILGFLKQPKFNYFPKGDAFPGAQKIAVWG